MLKFLPRIELAALHPAIVWRAIRAWVLANGVWWGSSVVGHVVVLSAVLLLLGKVATAPKEGDAPLFEAKLDTEIPPPQLDHFEIGDTPLDPSELNTETLSLVDAPKIDADQSLSETPDPVLVGGGTGAAPSGGIGGLDQFAVKALGPGPLVRGSGLAASGNSRAAGSGGAGAGFNARGDKDARRSMVGGYGGTKASERAVAGALNWLARHQNLDDGGWSLEGFSRNCKGEPCSGSGRARNADVGATAMALLPFLAAGQTHYTANSPYKSTVAGGLNWLINHEKANGDLRADGTMYNHGLATITLCEAYGLTKDSRIRIAAQAAIQFIEAAQYETGGWHYAANPQPDPYPKGDTSVVGWQVMALKSAQMAGLDVSEAAIEGAHKWLKLTSLGSNGGLFCYQPKAPATASMTAVGLLCTQYLGAHRDDAAIQEGMAFLSQHLPSEKARNCYYWYYATQVMHNLPGPEWDAWNRQMRRLLIESQVKEGCAAGSWDPMKPTPDPWQEQGGRIMVTSLCCLTLEVYYRYLPLYKLDAPDKPADENGAQTASAAKEAKPQP